MMKKLLRLSGAALGMLGLTACDAAPPQKAAVSQPVASEAIAPGETLVDVVRADLADIIRDGQACGEFRADADPISVATLLVSTFDGLGLQYSLDDSIDPIRSSEQFVLELCRGLCQEEQ